MKKFLEKKYIDDIEKLCKDISEDSIKYVFLGFL